MEMLNRMDTFQRAPVLEPDDVLLAALTHDRLVHEVVDLFAGLSGQVISSWVGDELEFGPNDEVDDAVGEAVGPVVVENLDVRLMKLLAEVVCTHEEDALKVACVLGSLNGAALGFWSSHPSRS